MEDPFSTESVSATIRCENPRGNLGPSGLRFSYLQELMTPDLCEAIAQLSRLIFEGTFLPDSCWRLHSCCNLPAIGENAAQWQAGLSYAESLGQRSVDSRHFPTPCMSTPLVTLELSTCPMAYSRGIISDPFATALG